MAFFKDCNITITTSLHFSKGGAIPLGFIKSELHLEKRRNNKYKKIVLQQLILRFS